MANKPARRHRTELGVLEAELHRQQERARSADAHTRVPEAFIGRPFAPGLGEQVRGAAKELGVRFRAVPLPALRYASDPWQVHDLTGIDPDVEFADEAYRLWPLDVFPTKLLRVLPKTAGGPLSLGELALPKNVNNNRLSLILPIGSAAARTAIKETRGVGAVCREAATLSLEEPRISLGRFTAATPDELRMAFAQTCLDLALQDPQLNAVCAVQLQRPN